MLATCTCGKKLFFGDDPGEQQVCDRCGQKVDSPLSSTDGPHSTPLPQNLTPKWDRPPKNSSPREFARSPMSSKLHVASDTQSPWRAIGCVSLIVLLLIGPAAADFLVYPPRTLMCGHHGKLAYVFGLVPLGHDCERLNVIYYMKDAREEVLQRAKQDADAVPGIAEMHTRPPSGAGYRFDVGTDGSIYAYPEDGEPELPYFALSIDGSLRRAIGEEPSESAPVVRTFK
jgi:hypothetical protein